MERSAAPEAIRTWYQAWLNDWDQSAVQSGPSAVSSRYVSRLARTLRAKPSAVNGFWMNGVPLR